MDPKQTAHLIANMDQVDVDTPTGVTLHINASALLLYTPRDFGSLLPTARNRVLAYGTDTSWIVFQLNLGCPWHEYEITKEELPSGLVPVASMLRWSDGTVLRLHPADRHHPIDVTETQAVGRALRNLLLPKVASYWKAPNMPAIRWVSAAETRFDVGPDRR